MVELAAAEATDKIIFCRPDNCIFVILAAFHVVKVVCGCDGRLPLHAPYSNVVICAFWSILAIAAIAILFVPDAAEPWQRTGALIALPIVTVVAGIALIRKLRLQESICKLLSLLGKKR